MHGLMCHQNRSAPASPGREHTLAPVPRPEHDPVEERDRSDAVTLLRRGFGDGVIAVTDLEDGLSAVYGARTIGEITAATSALPRTYVAKIERAEQARRAAAAAQARRRGEVRSYLRVMSLLLTIWLVVGITAGAWYPWPIWPALGWGLPLLSSGRASRRDYDLAHGAFRTDSG